MRPSMNCVGIDSPPPVYVNGPVLPVDGGRLER